MSSLQEMQRILSRVPQEERMAMDRFLDIHQEYMITDILYREDVYVMFRDWMDSQRSGQIGSFGRKSKQRTEGGSQIVIKPLLTNYSGPGGELTGVDDIKVARVKARNGTVYEVPIDEERYVTNDTLLNHFLDYTRWSRTNGGRQVSVDAARVADRIHTPKDPRGFTPEEIVNSGWWAYVNESDVKGIDDGCRQGSMGIEWEDVKQGAKVPFGRIAIIAPPESRKRMVKVMQDNFTNAELKRMTNQSGLVISEGPTPAGVDGFHRPRQKNLSTPNIVVAPGWDEDTLTHEMVHCARHTDETRTGLARTSFPMDGDMVYLPSDPVAIADAVSLEEASTVAETITRTRSPARTNGYYEYAETTSPKKGAQALYDEDRSRLVPGKPFRGKRAIDRTYSNLEDTNIAAMDYNGGTVPRKAIAKGRAEGRYPEKGKVVHNKPRKKSGPKTAEKTAKPIRRKSSTTAATAAKAPPMATAKTRGGSKRGN